MSSDLIPRTDREDFVALLYTGAETLIAELRRRMAIAGYSDVREAHGCVFGNIEPEGLRLTELAARAGMTKQAVGEAVSDLEGLGYAERAPDPSDGRAKVIRLTERGREAQRTAFGVMADIEHEWVQAFGAERVDAMRSLLLDITAGAHAERAPLASVA